MQGVYLHVFKQFQVVSVATDLARGSLSGASCFSMSLPGPDHQRGCSAALGLWEWARHRRKLSKFLKRLVAWCVGSPMRYLIPLTTVASLLSACSKAPMAESPPGPAPAPKEAKPPVAKEVKPDVPKPSAPSEVKTGWRAELEHTDRLSFRFNDATVAPKWQRNMSITVTPSEVRQVVDSYGDTISETSNPISAEQFHTLLASLEPLGVDKAPDIDAPIHCSGGTSYDLALFVGKHGILKGRQSSCGRKATGVLRGDLEELGARALALVREPWTR